MFSHTASYGRRHHVFSCLGFSVKGKGVKGKGYPFCNMATGLPRHPLHVGSADVDTSAATRPSDPDFVSLADSVFTISGVPCWGTYQKGILLFSGSKSGFVGSLFVLSFLVGLSWLGISRQRSQSHVSLHVCCFGGESRSVSWSFSDVLKPPPAFKPEQPGSFLPQQRVTWETPVVHAGATIKFSLAKGSLVPLTLEDFKAETHLTVRDVRQLLGKHGLACRQKQEELLADCPDAVCVESHICVKDYSLDSVHFVLGYDLLCDADFEL